MTGQELIGNTADAAVATTGAAGPRPTERDLAAALPLGEKVRLLTGADAWRTQGIPAIGLQPMTTSDGPNGVRGTVKDERHPSACLPCPSGLGATWNPDLVRRIAAALGAEAKSKAVDVLLGPTVNLMRTPLGGRGFEFFAEDPVLTATVAGAYVRGVQSAGVAATVKHFVANDTETERRTYDARLSESVLRELYLVPFEACVRQAGAWLVMAAYNKVNGTPMTENPRLLRDVLKNEWGFDGVVVSDWDAARSTDSTALATLDLSMPGPDGPWGELLVRAVQDGVVSTELLDDKVARLLRLARRVGALTAPLNGKNGNVAAGAGAVRQEAVLIDPDLLREAAAESFVLLRNADDALPLTADQLDQTTSVAIIGPNAVNPVIQGGGSAGVVPVSVSRPADALAAALPAHVVVSRSAGCQTWHLVPEPRPGSLTDPVSGTPGLRLEFTDGDGTVIGSEHRGSPSLAWWDGVPAGVGWGKRGRIALTTTFRPEVTGSHLLSVCGVGGLMLEVDGVTVIDGETTVPADPVEAMTRPGELRAKCWLEAGVPVRLRIEFAPAADGAGPLAVRLGIVLSADDDALLAEAEAAAAAADVAIVVVGSAELTESEGFDRPGLALPGRQDELVSRVAAVNRRTIVVVNSGMPVLMPWAGQAAAVLFAWLPGQEFGSALAHVLLGETEPGGRLPVTMPAAEADCPVLHASPAPDGTLDYAEGLLVGYRGYDAADVTPAYPFGSGLGYTSWAYEVADCPAWLREGTDLELTVRVRNVGTRAGKEVVQAYLAEPSDAARPHAGPHAGPRRTGRPVRVLAAFAVARAEAGESSEVRLVIPARMFARYEESLASWIVPGGEFTVHVGRSSRDLPFALPVRIVALRTRRQVPADRG